MIRVVNNALDIERMFFEFTKTHRKTPSRKEFVEYLGIPGHRILELLGDSSENLDRIWGIDEQARKFLAEKILESDPAVRRLLGNICFLPLWSIECEIRARKLNDPDYDPSVA